VRDCLRVPKEKGHQLYTSPGIIYRLQIPTKYSCNVSRSLIIDCRVLYPQDLGSLGTTARRGQAAVGFDPHQ
jgi:hypothetical protein